MKDEYVNIYESIDPALFRWARRRLLRWDTSYRDEEVRQIFFGGWVGPRVQMSATPLGDGSRVAVFISFYPSYPESRSEDRQYEGTPDELPTLLDAAHAQVRTWLGKHPLTWGQRLGRLLRPRRGAAERPGGYGPPRGHSQQTCERYLLAARRRPVWVADMPRDAQSENGMSNAWDYAGGGPPPLPLSVRPLAVQPLPAGEPVRVSGFGIASCALGAIALALVAASGAVMVVGRAGGGGQPTAGDFAAGLAMLASGCGGVLLALTGLVLGAIGASSGPDCRTEPAYIGLLINGGAIAALLGLAAL